MSAEDDPAVADIEGFDPERAIQAIINHPDPKSFVKNSRSSGISLQKLQLMAKYLKLPTFRNKDVLLESILTRKRNEGALADIYDKINDNSSFRKDKNTFPRICNFMLQYPDAVMRTTALATRQQLQNKEINQNQDIFVTSATSYNDWDANSGGLIEGANDDEIFADIDPEERNTTGPITNLLVYTMWKETLKKYSQYLSNWERSGQNDPTNFWRFCNNNLDVYYLHYWLKYLKNPELNSHCADRSVLSCGIDSGDHASSFTAIATSSNSTSTSSDSNFVAPSPVPTHKRTRSDSAELRAYIREKSDINGALVSAALETQQQKHKQMLKDAIRKSEDRVAMLMSQPDYNSDEPSSQFVRAKRDLEEEINEYDEWISRVKNSKK